ncbi:unnamed protein product [Meganyctiphanes norvegica]|uniref:Peptidase S1 domain-containing protein n=1 Tax=Meganyctiphanes norvegica TaxID=48144 RepID=A0AAV2PUC1_MEGNR
MLFRSWLSILLYMSSGSWAARLSESQPVVRALENNSTGNVVSSDTSCEVDGEIGQCMMTWDCMHQRGQYDPGESCPYKRILSGICCIISKDKVKDEDSTQKDISSFVGDNFANIAEHILEYASGIIPSIPVNNHEKNHDEATERPNKQKPPKQKLRDGNRKKKPNRSNGNTLIAIDPLRTGEAECGVTKMSLPQGRIVNGTDAVFGEFPWQVTLWADKHADMYFSHLCGGTLVSKSWIVTAAHCLEHIPSLEMLKVRIGEHDLATENERYPYIERKIKRKYSHPKFDFPTFKYDIALLELNEPVTEQPNIGFICLPGSNNDLNRMTGWATGWGRLENEGSLPSVLQKVPLTIMKNKECKKSFKTAGRIEPIPKIFLCAADVGRDACAGDSGGPLQLHDVSTDRWFLGGIVSWGIGCARPNHPGVYTRVSKFMPFIKKTIYNNS